MARTPRVFLDSSALIAGVLSPSGGARAILVLAETEALRIVISQQVQVECERVLRIKAPMALAAYQRTLQGIQLEVCSDPTPEQVTQAEQFINIDDATILAAAIGAAPDYVVSLDRKHFLQPEVAQRTGLRIGTPGDFLAWLRERTASA